MPRTPLLSAVVAVAGLIAVESAWAQPMSPPAGVLNLQTTATIEVPRDVLSVVFSVTREGNDAQAVQSALKQALDAALAEARRMARPDQVEVQTGNFSLHPRYSQPGPRGGTVVITGWTGSAELTVQGKDIAAIAQLTGRVQTMTIARVGYTLSREMREKVETEAVAQAIARWRAKAQQMSQQFGYGGYTVREVNVSTNEPGPGPVPVMMRAKVMAAGAEEALPTESGKGEVTATVSGSAQMTR